MSEKALNFYLTQDNTGSAPTAATEGQPVKDLDAILVVLEVANVASHTLAATGALRCYGYAYRGDVSAPNGWYRIPDSDLVVPTAAAGLVRISFNVIEIPAPIGARLFWMADGLTQGGGGTQVKTYQLGYSKAVRSQYG